MYKYGILLHMSFMYICNGIFVMVYSLLVSCGATSRDRSIYYILRVLLYEITYHTRFIIIISLFTHCNKNNGTIKKNPVNFTFQFKHVIYDIFYIIISIIMAYLLYISLNITPLDATFLMNYCLEFDVIMWKWSFSSLYIAVVNTKQW